ncbi:MAG: hypothetical protein AAF481_18440 [Acidobacteriota bacterium]
MTEPRENDYSFAGTRQRQLRLGLELTPVERLRWLEERVAEMLALQDWAAQARERSVEPEGSGSANLQAKIKDL